MKKSDILQMPEYFERYINLIGDIELSQAFDESLAQIDNLDLNKLERLAGQTYAEGKWTVNSTIQHLTDMERVFNYRALLFARKDPNQRQGVDEDAFAQNAKADAKSISELIAELRAVRLATKALFMGFDAEMLQTKNICWKYEISVLAIGFSILGHQLHHFNIISERYFPLLGETSQGANQ